MVTFYIVLSILFQIHVNCLTDSQKYAYQGFSTNDDNMVHIQNMVQHTKNGMKYDYNNGIDDYNEPTYRHEFEFKGPNNEQVRSV